MFVRLISTLQLEAASIAHDEDKLFSKKTARQPADKTKENITRRLLFEFLFSPFAFDVKKMDRFHSVCL